MFMMIDKTLLKPEMFHNKRSYDAALYLADIFNKILVQMEKGAKLSGEHYNDFPHLEIDRDGVPHMGFSNGNGSMTVFLGHTTDCESGLVYATKKEIKESLKNVRLIVESKPVAELL